MGTLADLRHGRTRYGALAAAASVFVPVTLAAWLSWQVLEGEAGTLSRSDFREWLVVASGTAVLACALAGAFWRSRGALVGAAVGAVLAGLAVLGGLGVDLVTSGGLA